MKIGKSHLGKQIRGCLPLYLMMVPGIIYLIINNCMPMAGLLLAFKKVNYTIGIFNSPWCGFDNFKYLFSSNDAFLILRNTVLYNLAFIFLGNLMGLFTAIALESIRAKWFRNLSQIFILIPFLLSTVIISYVVYAFLSGSTGYLNKSVFPLFDIAPVNFYTKASCWPPILIIVYLWMSFGYTSILYYSTLIGIDKTYYEAAVVDGATIWQQIKYITMPCMKTTIITLILLAVGRICYSDFGLFYQVPMNSGLLYKTTQTIDTYVFRALLERNDIGRSTAAGFLQSVLGFACIMIANTAVSKVDKESSLF